MTNDKRRKRKKERRKTTALKLRAETHAGFEKVQKTHKNQTSQIKSKQKQERKK